MATVDDLPAEMLNHIIRYLGIKDIVRVRLVSKLWKTMVDMQKIDELAIFPNSRDYPVYANKWFYTDDKVDSNKVLKLNFRQIGCKIFCHSVPQLNLLINLKRLKINTGRICKIDGFFNNLSLFTALEQLDFKMSFCKDQTIRHDNLKFLYIGYNITNFSLNLHTPNLQCIHMAGCLLPHFVKIDRVASIKYLSGPIFRLPRNFLSQAKNLERIECEAKFFNIADLWMEELPKLNEIRFKSNCFNDENLILQNARFNMFIDSMTQLFRTKDRLNRADLKVYMNDNEMTNVDQFEQFKAYFYILISIS